MPVLVITGTKDFAIGTTHYQSFAYPKQSIVHYIGGHCPFQEEPQWFAEKVISFLLTINTGSK
jgi:proline iminopeptidase